MAYGAIDRMRQEGDLKGLFGVLEGEDQHKRRMATETLCTFCSPEAAEKLAQLKFRDTISVSVTLQAAGMRRSLHS
ncbi:MAG: hypothetical protein QCH35_03115 [Methanomicrobiaceae archaeon]|nr:hypothetical protein [Methanomicrobiaceae archaeon]